MELNKTQWDNAESEFLDAHYNKPWSNNEFTDVIKNAFAFSRNKLKQAIRLLSEDAEQKLAETGIVRESENLIEDRINFCFAEEKRPYEIIEAERKSNNRKKNKAIIDGILSANSTIYFEIYENEFPKIIRMVVKNTGSLEQAKDIFQDGLLIVVENILQRKLEITESFDTYLYAVCRNLWLQQIAQQKKKQKFIDEYSYESFDYYNYDEFVESNDKYLEIIESLGETCKKLLELCYFRKMSWQKITDELGYASTGSARNQKYKCLERIRKHSVVQN